MAVMRRLAWNGMTEVQRAALCHRGLDEIFDPVLKEAIGRIIADVRANGDEAVCRALRDFDRISLKPEDLRVSPEEIAIATVPESVDSAIDAAITNLRTFNDAVRQRAGDWWIESRPCLLYTSPSPRDS